MKNKYIPFNSVSIQGNEQKYLQDCLERDHLSGDGFYTNKCNEILQDYLSVNKALLTTSCTHAMEMAALLLDIQPGDEIIVPSYTFVSTINPFILRGAKPVFIDIREDTLNLDEQKIQSLITKKTKAILPVHYAGVGCDMDEILKIAKKNNIQVIEDNAHGLFGKYKNRYLGTFGIFSTLSFHETKNYTCGEGGALLINSKDETINERAEIIREKGTNRSKFFRGEVQKYSWVDVGSSYLPSDLLAAFLYGQLESKDIIQEKRKTLWNTYHKLLTDWAETNNIRLAYVPEECDQAYHMFYMIMPSKKDRDKFIQYLLDNNIKSVFHYLPLHESEMGRKYFAADCQISTEMSSRLIRLPFYSNLDLSGIDFDIFYNYKVL